MLPFSTPNNSDSEYVITDDFGNSLPIKKYGCLTWAEYMFWIDFDNKKKQDEEANPEKPVMTLGHYMEAIVTSLLRLRFQIPKDQLSDEDILKNPDGRSISESMVRAIYDFFSKELVRWQTAPVVETDEKKTTAKKS